MSTEFGSIMRKVEEWSKSDEGQKRMKSKIKDYQSGKNSKVNSTGKTHGGGVILTETAITDLAKDFLDILRKTAASCDLPASVMEHIESFECADPVINDDSSASIAIYMKDDAYRPSLYPEKYPRGHEKSMTNIVAAFNRGIHANGEVFGIWKDKRIVSLQTREGKWFIQRAVEEFEALHGAKYGVTVRIDSEYSGDTSGG